MLRHLTTVLLACVLLVPFGASAVTQGGAGASGSAPENEPSGGDAVDATPEARARAMVKDWQDLLTELEGSVRNADEEAIQEIRGRVVELVDKMTLHVATGHEELLARALRLLDLAAPRQPLRQRLSGPRGSLFTPAQSLHLARQLWPAVTEDLAKFGDGGEALQRGLREHDRKARKLREEAAKAREKRDFVPPNRQGSFEHRYPPPATAAGVEAVVQVRYLIDEDGIPFAPEVQSPDVPSSLLLAGLRTVMDARYEPAMVGTRMVPAEETIAVRFETP